MDPAVTVSNSKKETIPVAAGNESHQGTAKRGSKPSSKNKTKRQNDKKKKKLLYVIWGQKPFADNQDKPLLGYLRASGLDYHPASKCARNAHAFSNYHRSVLDKACMSDLVQKMERDGRNTYTLLYPTVAEARGHTSLHLKSSDSDPNNVHCFRDQLYPRDNSSEYLVYQYESIDRHFVMRDVYHYDFLGLLGLDPIAKGLIEFNEVHITIMVRDFRGKAGWTRYTGSGKWHETLQEEVVEHKERWDVTEAYWRRTGDVISYYSSEKNQEIEKHPNATQFLFENQSGSAELDGEHYHYHSKLSQNSSDMYAFQLSIRRGELTDTVKVNVPELAPIRELKISGRTVSVYRPLLTSLRRTFSSVPYQREAVYTSLKLKFKRELEKSLPKADWFFDAFPPSQDVFNGSLYYAHASAEILEYTMKSIPFKAEITSLKANEFMGVSPVLAKKMASFSVRQSLIQFGYNVVITLKEAWSWLKSLFTKAELPDIEDFVVLVGEEELNVFQLLQATRSLKRFSGIAKYGIKHWRRYVQGTNWFKKRLSFGLKFTEKATIGVILGFFWQFGKRLFLAVGEELLKRVSAFFTFAIVLAEAFFIFIKRFLGQESVNVSDILYVIIRSVFHFSTLLIPLPLAILAHWGMNVAISALPLIAEVRSIIHSLVEDFDFQEYRVSPQELCVITAFDPDPNETIAFDVAKSLFTEENKSLLLRANLKIKTRGMIKCPVTCLEQISDAILETAKPLPVLTHIYQQDCFGMPVRNLATSLMAAVYRVLPDPIVLPDLGEVRQAQLEFKNIVLRNLAPVGFLNFEELIDYLRDRFPAWKVKAYELAIRKLLEGTEEGKSRLSGMPKTDEKLLFRVLIHHDTLKVRMITMIDLTVTAHLMTAIIPISKNITKWLNSGFIPNCAQQFDPAPLSIADPNMALYACIPYGWVPSDMDAYHSSSNEIEGLHVMIFSDDIRYDFVFDEPEENFSIPADVSKYDVHCGEPWQKWFYKDVLEEFFEYDRSDQSYNATFGDITIRISKDFEVTFTSKKPQTRSGSADTSFKGSMIHLAILIHGYLALAKMNFSTPAQYRAGAWKVLSENYLRMGFPIKENKITGPFGTTSFERCDFLSGRVIQTSVGPLWTPISPVKLVALKKSPEKMFPKTTPARARRMACYGLSQGAQIFRRNPMGRVILDSYERYYAESHIVLTESEQLQAIMEFRDYRVMESEHPKQLPSEEEWLDHTVDVMNAVGLNFDHSAYLAMISFFEMAVPFVSRIPDNAFWQSLVDLHYA